jgi:hypothetical protein
VAKKVSICSDKLPCLTLNAQAALPGSAITKPFWVLYDDSTGEESEVPFDAKTVAKLGEKYNLLTTEESFNAAANATGGKTSPLWAQAGSYLEVKILMIALVLTEQPTGAMVIILRSSLLFFACMFDHTSF